MSQKAIQISFFAVFTAVICVLLFYVMRPFLVVIFLSGTIVVVFYPLYKRLLFQFKERKNLASFVTTFLILIFIIVPVIVFSVLLLKEAIGLYNFISLGGGSQDFIARANILVNKLDVLFPSGVISFPISLEVYVRDVLNWIIGRFDSIFVIVFGGILNFILMLLSVYYLFIFGDKIKTGLKVWSPLPDKFDEEFIQTMRLSIDAVLRGRILVAVTQGAFIGIGFAIFGIGSPVLWGFVGAISSLVPVLGSSVVVVPAIAYLFVTGHVGSGLGLLVWGALVVGLIDNVLSIMFFKDKIKVHPLVVLFSILGGIEVFGAIGFLVGPVIVSAFLALMKIYPFIMSYKNQSVTDGG
jgi:predicted PurR-regulated permease PerM